MLVRFIPFHLTFQPPGDPKKCQKHS